MLFPIKYTCVLLYFVDDKWTFAAAVGAVADDTTNYSVEIAKSTNFKYELLR